MAQVYHTISIIAFSIGASCLGFALFCWFKFDIWKIIGDLNGRNAKKSIEQMRADNKKIENKAFRPTPVAVNREPLTGIVTGELDQKTELLGARKMKRAKKKTGTRFLTVLMSLVLTVSIIPVNVLASNTKDPGQMIEPFTGNPTETLQKSIVQDTEEVFTVTVSCEGNGNVSCQGMSAESMTLPALSTPEFTVTQEAGSHILAFVVNGEDQLENLIENEEVENQYIFQMAEIKDDIQIDAVFALDEEEQAGSECLEGESYKITFGDNDIIRTYTENDGMVVILPKETIVTIEPKDMEEENPYNHIRLNDTGKPQKQILLEETTDISKLTVSKGTLGYRDPKNIAMNLKLVIDKDAPEICMVPEEPGQNGYYNADTMLTVSAKDKDIYSGMKELNIWCDGTLLPFEEPVPDLTGKRPEVSAAVRIDADIYNKENVEVWAVAEDYAGNVSQTEKIILHINSTAPTMKVEMSDDRSVFENSIYKTVRTATVTMTDRADTFDESAAEKMIKNGIRAKNLAGEDLTDDILEKMDIVWDTEENDTSIHVAKVHFDEDAIYHWGFSEENTYTNKAGLRVDTEKIEASGDDVWDFTVDQSEPSHAYITDSSTVWNKLFAKLTFGIWKNKDVTVTAKAEDLTSGIEKIEYYKKNISEDTGMAEDEKVLYQELEELYGNGDFSDTPYTVSEDEIFAVYARITDRAGNYIYLNTDGIIVDQSSSLITLTPDKANENAFYHADFNVAVSIEDMPSGIKSAVYRVTSDGEVTQEGTFEIEENKTLSLGELTTSLERTVPVIAADNNTDHVVVSVAVEDHAGNRTVAETEELRVCVDKPEISVTFSDEPSNVVGDSAYYKEARMATVTVKDRASVFDGEAAAKSIVIEAVDADGNPIVDENGKKVDTSEMISGWMTDADDPDIHIATITFDRDANYVWSVSENPNIYVNKADHECKSEEIVSDEEDNPFAFTVDGTKPFGIVSVDHHDGIWKEILHCITFGLYKNDVIEVWASSGDVTSPTKISYYVKEYSGADGGSGKPMTEEELDMVTFIEFATGQTSFRVEKEQQFVAYIKVADYAGNYIYMSSNGDILDTRESEIIFMPDEANENGIYNKDVNVEIYVKDPFPYSGINRVEYEVTRDGEKTQGDVLFTFTKSDPLLGELQETQDLPIVVSSEQNNSCNVSAKVTTIDNAGNENVKIYPLDIDIAPPEISVTYDNNGANKIVDNRGYFSQARTATVAIKERTHHFDAEAATESLKKAITAVDVNGNEVSLDKDSMISTWTTVEGIVPDEAVHTATVTFHTDANYTFNPYYTDRAGNGNRPVDYGTSVTPEEFSVDRNRPAGQITAEAEEGWKRTWTEKTDHLTFGLWSNRKISLTGSARDITSPIESVQYYKTAGETALTEEDLQRIEEWKVFDGVTVIPNEQFTVYLRLEDYAGNVSFVSTDGMIADNEHPREEVFAPEITVNPQQPVNDIYHTDVKVDIRVIDPTAGNTYSGLKNIRYEVLNMGQITQSGDLYVFANPDPKRDELLQVWTGSITVDKMLNNSNDVRIIVYSEDNAGNTSWRYADIQIDVTRPDIDISYDNNMPDSTSYYNRDRVATIVVTERNFNPDDVIINITNTDGVIPEISGWKSVGGSGNGDDMRHIATISYQADGDYTFAISYTDRAGNICPGAKFVHGTATPTEFTIDKTNPVISVSYNNNNAQNGTYFNAYRTATVTVQEHNFDASRVIFTRTAVLDGASITVPAVSWSDHGDIHTATINFNADGDYTFDVAMTDRAGNQSGEAGYGNSVAAKSFTVDTTIVKPVFSGVENGMAYKDDVWINITFADVNFDQSDITLLRTHLVQRDGKVTANRDEDVTEEFIRNVNITDHGISSTDNMIEKVQENDGIYTLTVNVSDQAGNQESESITFTVNRFGSVYDINDYLLDHLQDAYVMKVDQDIVITEYNASQLEAGSLKFQITRDGTPIRDVKVSPEPVVSDQAAIGGSGWYQYEYVIDADNFNTDDGEALDGVYKLSISSKDKAGNEPETTNYAEYDFLFRIDSTKPEFPYIKGMEEAIVNATEQKVTFEAFDVIGLEKVDVSLNGTVIETFESGDDLTSISGTFIIPEGSMQEAELIATDLAGNVRSTADKDFEPGYAYNHVLTISTNFFIRWFANKPLFWGSVSVVAAVIVGGFLVIFVKRKNYAVCVIMI